MHLQFINVDTRASLPIAWVDTLQFIACNRQRYQIKTCKYYKKYFKKYQIFTLIWTRPEGQRPLYNTLKWLRMDYYLRNFSIYGNITYFLQ